MADNTDASEVEEERKKPSADEMYCTECGEIIKKQAEICPECGVRQDGASQFTGQQPQGNTNNQLTERRQYELEKIAGKDKATVAIVGFLLSPVAYWMIGKKGLALLNFFTLNYLLLGIIVVPIHCWKIISDAEEELRIAGVGGY